MAGGSRAEDEGGVGCTESGEGDGANTDVNWELACRGLLRDGGRVP